MKKLQVPDGISRTFHKVGFKLKKHSPEILVGVGIIGGVASAVMACKATLKVDEVVEKHNDKVDRIHTAVESGVTDAGKEYTVEDSKKDLTIVYVQTGYEFVKLYAPAVALGTLSIASVLTGHNLMRKRYLATAAAYTALDKGFKDYRGRVKERFGEALDRELRYGIQTKEYDEIVVDEDGSESVVKKQEEVIDSKNLSPYSFFFDASCMGWSKDPEYNKMFLIDQEAALNRKLKQKGLLVLNDLHDAVGLERTKAGQVMGWVYNPSNPDLQNEVKLNIFDATSERKRAFVNGHEPVLLIEPNLDGNIYEMM